MSNGGMKSNRCSEYRVGLKKFIAAYRAQPCLWQVRHKDYYNREKRNDALSVLVKKLRLVEPGATRDDVLRKINSLRCIYKKEHRKVMEAKRTGEERVVSLWCYKLMSFIDRRLQIPEAGEREREDDEEEVGEEEDEQSEEVIFIKEDIDFLEDEGNESNEYNSLEVLDETMEDEEEIEIPVKQPRLEYAISETSHSMTESRTEDCHDAYCRSIAYKLRGMPREQRLLAEKLMNEVLFEAECGALTRQHRLERYPSTSGILWSHLTRDQDKPPSNSVPESK